MLFDSAIISRGSGSLAGLTASRNRGGNYFRARAMPTNPNTVFQQTVRSFMADLSSRWASVLTRAQRDAWDLYALNVPLTGPLGNPRNVGGLGMYQRSNVSRLNAQEATILRIDDAPTIFNLGDFTLPVVDSASETADTLSISYDNTDDWANEDDAAMLISVSRPDNESINFFKGPYRFAAAVLGDGTTPPTSPEVVDAPFPFALGQRLFVFIRVARADGRLSASFRGTVVGS